MSIQMEEKKKSVSESTKRERILSPTVNVFENEKEAVFVVDLPGVPEENIEITLEKGQLQIEGRVSIPMKSEYEKEYNEVYVDLYRRKFSLGKAVDPEKAIAKFKNGQLRLVLPKDEPVKKKIQITAGE